MYLPKAPSIQQRMMYQDSGRLKLYIVSSVSTLFLMVGMILFVRVNPGFIPYTLFAGLTLLYLVATYLIGFAGRDFDIKNHSLLVAKWFDRSQSQRVDIFLPICGEPFEVIENTWRHVSKLRALHEGDLRIYVLDDGKSEEAKRLAESMRFEYITRPTNELKKAGNLRNAFMKTDGEFFVIFDADFCPSTSFFIETLPYFYEDESVAIVQTPQFFEYDKDQTWVQRGAGAIQELFYRLIQVNRDTFKGAICVGTNAVYRREPLVKFGGTAAIGYSEDVRTGFRLTADQKAIKYVPRCLAMGTCPETWKQFFTQQYRWAMGSIDLMLSREFWTAKLTVMQRACYITGMLYYTTTGVGIMFAFVPSIYLLLYKPEFVHWYNLLWSIPSLLLTNLYMRYWQKVRFTWAAVECRQVSYYAHFFALVDTILKTKEEWVPTGARAKSGRYEVFRKLVYWHTLSILVIVAGLIGYRAATIGLINVLPLSFLFVFHALTLESVRDGYKEFIEMKKEPVKLQDVREAV
jgi:cellulose synthase/poly-beta-1,6-N-acetylglucosamine synthase-like glycosyltransferase